MNHFSIAQTGFPAVPQNNFPWLLVKNLPFFPDKNAEKGQFFPDSRWKCTFFPWPKRGFFGFAIKISFLLLNNTTISCTLVRCANFSDYNDYSEDPPWLGPTRKFLKIGIQRLAKNHQILSKAFWKKIPWLFPDFWGILQKFPDFSRFSLTFSKNSPFSRFSRFSLTAGNPVKPNLQCYIDHPVEKGGNERF